MAVVKNLMIRIGADYSAARQGMQGATRELTKFRRDTEKTITSIGGKKGLGGISGEFKAASASVTSSFKQIQGAKGIGGVVSALGSLRPALGAATAGMEGLAISGVGVAAALGPVGITLGVFTVALGIFAYATYKASQEAVKFESSLGRIQMQLKGSTRSYMDWARAQGLAKSTAAELGATYSVLLSSFTKDNKQLADQTKQLVQTTRVVASATGRTIEDTQERIRSGLLGNTEAVEDLGIFVNISMIESTKAFKKFANGKHWDQLDFRVQQQIRLQAILEQAYDRYGDKLQNNVMTKQEKLSEQLKDIKLNLSQAFLPIWDAILPPLTALAKALATVTENIARFMYWISGKNYDAATRGLDQQTDAVNNQSGAYDDLAKSAEKAKSELASFDELNLIGGKSGGSSNVGGGMGGPNTPTPPGGGTSPGPSLPDLPKIFRIKIEFDLPKPPDLGAVVTSIWGTVNDLAADINKRLSEMWDGVKGGWSAGLNYLQTQLNAYQPYLRFGFGLIGVSIAALTGDLATLKTNWHDALDYLQSQLNAYQPYLSFGWSLIGASIRAVGIDLSGLRIDWHDGLDYLQNQLNAYQPYLSYGWQLIGAAIGGVSLKLQTVRIDWHDALDYMQGQINSYQPYLSFGWSLIGLSIKGVATALGGIETAWDRVLTGMGKVATNALSPIVSMIDSVTSAWDKMTEALTGAVKSVKDTGAGVIGNITGAFSQDNLSRMWDFLKGEAAKPENKIGTAATVGIGSIPAIAGAGAAAGVGTEVAAAIRSLSQLLNGLKGLGGVPAFAGGGIVYGPTLAMVGDNHGAASNPEVIGPLSDVQDLMGGGDSADVVQAVERVEKAVRDLRYIRAVMSRDEAGKEIAAYLDDLFKRGYNPFPNM